MNNTKRNPVQKCEMFTRPDCETDAFGRKYEKNIRALRAWFVQHVDNSVWVEKANSNEEAPVVPLHRWLHWQDAQFGRKSLNHAGKWVNSCSRWLTERWEILKAILEVFWDVFTEGWLWHGRMLQDRRTAEGWRGCGRWKVLTLLPRVHPGVILDDRGEPAGGAARRSPWSNYMDGCCMNDTAVRDTGAGPAPGLGVTAPDEA